MNADFIKALVKVQAELPTLAKTSTNPHFKSKFAPLDEVNPAALAVLTRHGFAWVTMPCVLTDGTPGLRYRLMHESGEELVGEMALMLKASGPQEQGSAITYARRYSVQAVLGLVTDEDDDGNSAARPKRQTVTPLASVPTGRTAGSETPKGKLWAHAHGTLGWDVSKLGDEFGRWSKGQMLNDAGDDQLLDFLAVLQADAAS